MLRILDNMSEPMVVIGFITLVITGVIFAARHEENHEFMTERYAYEAKRSPMFMFLMGILLLVILVGWGLDDISKPNQRIIYKDRVVEKIVNVPGPKVRVLKLREVEPDLVQDYKRCIMDKNGTYNASDSQTICRKYVNDVKEVSLLDKAKVITVYRQLPYSQYYETCMESMQDSRLSRKEDSQHCTSQAAKKLKGLVQYAQAKARAN